MGKVIEFEAKARFGRLLGDDRYAENRKVLVLPMDCDVRSTYRVTLTPVEPELKPCPFCGGEVRVKCDDDTTHGKPEWWVECPDRLCGAWSGTTFDSREAVVEWWNRRAK
jgi:hypothetical protein